jgi:hypothetical protein
MKRRLTMREPRRQLWHRLSRVQAAVLTAVAALDGVLLLAICYAALRSRPDLAVLIAPTYSALFLVLAGSLARFAERGRASWPLVAAVMLVGPFGAIVALRAGRRSPSR